MKTTPTTMEKLNTTFADYMRGRCAKAGPHKCVAVPAGAIRRLTGRGGKQLKRPVVVARFYECKHCGKDMRLDG